MSALGVKRLCPNDSSIVCNILEELETRPQVVLAPQVQALVDEIREKDARIAELEEIQVRLDKLAGSYMSRMVDAEDALRKSIKTMEEVADCLQRPNQAVCDTIWIDGMTTAVDALNYRIEIIHSLLQRGDHFTDANKMIPDTDCLWEAYQQDQSFSNLTQFLGHRAYCRIQRESWP